jgi:hypothetical protein
MLHGVFPFFGSLPNLSEKASSGGVTERRHDGSDEGSDRKAMTQTTKSPAAKAPGGYILVCISYARRRFLSNLF